MDEPVNAPELDVDSARLSLLLGVQAHDHKARELLVRLDRKPIYRSCRSYGLSFDCAKVGVMEAPEELRQNSRLGFATLNAYRLFVIEKLEASEVAWRLSIPPTSVHVVVFQVRKHLQEHLSSLLA